jgi:phage terminase Nu1 subunit (DNA packaging protein)
MLFEAESGTPKTLRKTDFAKLTGVTPARVSHWVKAGIPVTPNGRINVEEGMKWLDENVDPARRENWSRTFDDDAPEVPQFRFAQIIHASPKTVSRFVKAGLPVEPNGRIDVEKGWAWLRAQKAAEEAGEATSRLSARPPREAVTATARPAPSAARGKRDVAEAEIARLKAEKLAGRLIDQRATLRIVEGRARFERDAWIGWVNRAAPLVASEAGADLALVVAILDREVRAQLAALAATPLELPNE